MADVASNKSYLDERMNSIRSTASNGITGITIASSDYTSTTRIPSAEPEIENNLLNGIKTLFQKIITEVDSIKEVGTNFQEMDNFLAGASTSLGFDVVSKEEPIVDLEDYSSMSFNDLLNASIPSVPDSYSGNNNYGGYNNSGSGGYSGYNGGQTGNYSSDNYTPYTGRESGNNSSGYTYTTPSVTMPQLVTPTRTAVSLSSTSSTSTSDSNPLSGVNLSSRTNNNSNVSSNTSRYNSSDLAQRISSDNSSDGVTVTRLGSNKSGGVRSGGTGSNVSSGYNSRMDTTSTIEDDIVSEELLGNEIVNDNVVEDYNETINVETPEVVEENVVTPSEPVKDNKSVLKSLGIATAVGIASGAAGLATHKILKDKEDYEDEEYGYESEGDF